MKSLDLDKIYDSEDFKRKGYALIDTLAKYLDDSVSSTRDVLSLTDPEVEYAYWDHYEPEDLIVFNQDLINRSISLHHPKYIGHQVSPAMPDLALLGLTSDLLNNGMGVYEMGAAATAIERWVINELSSKVGFSNENAGFLTSGGTLANLTALLAARAHSITQYGENQKWTILVSEQAHFCVERAATTMGLGIRGITKIPSDQNYQVDLDALQDIHQQVINDGLKVMAVVGCACSTATGSYDDLQRLSDFCQINKYWFHVDGAHGGAVIYSDRYKHLVNGINNADSVVIDLHKMMLTPALATAVLFNDADRSYNSFKQKADYLFNKVDKDPHNLAKRTYETTKYMMCIKGYYLLKKYRKGLLQEYIDRQHDLSRSAYQVVQQHDEYEAMHEPMSNILCFRYINDTPDVLNSLNVNLRQTLTEQGEYYIVSTILDEQNVLRVTFMNPLTTIDHFETLLSRISEIAQQIKSSN